MIETLIIKSLMSYVVTFVVASSSLLEPVRAIIKRKIPRLQIGNHKHFIDCRMCVGFWASALVCVYDISMVLPVYGISYFLATQER